MWGSLALRGGHEELGGHGDEDAVVSGGVIAEGLAQLAGHEAGVAGGSEQVLEAGEQFLARGGLGGQARSDARAQWDQLLAAQLSRRCRFAVARTASRPGLIRVGTQGLPPRPSLRATPRALRSGRGAPPHALRG